MLVTIRSHQKGAKAMARWIKTDGTVEQVYPTNRIEFSLEEMRSFVGGHLEAIKLTSQEVMYVNEDFAGLQLPINAVATEVLHQHRPDYSCYPICGNVLIASLQETGDEPNALHVQAVPPNEKCTECGKVPALQWTLYGMIGVLCQDCLGKEVDSINETLQSEWE